MRDWQVTANKARHRANARKILWYVWIIGFAHTSLTQAEVTAKDFYGFGLQIISEVKTTPAQTYLQFIRIQDWWIADHTYFGDASNLSLSPSAGSCFCEINGAQQVLHMTVSFVDPNKQVKLLGGLGPLQDMGLHGAMSWSFEPTNEGTRIVQTYNVSGYTPGGLEALAEIVDNVQSQQQQSLTRLLNNR